jgi:putative pyruvate formate lyase activating enzyme
LDVIRFVEEHFAPDEVLFSLMRQYIPCGRVSETEFPELNRTVTDEEYEIVENALLDSTIEAGFVQDLSSASKDFIPAFDGSGV